MFDSASGQWKPEERNRFSSSFHQPFIDTILKAAPPPRRRCRSTVTTLVAAAISAAYEVVGPMQVPPLRQASLRQSPRVQPYFLLFITRTCNGIVLRAN